MVNRKFFDIVLVYNEYELLKTRLKVLEPYVNTFVVFDFGQGCENLASHNVLHIKAPEHFLSEDFSLVHEAIKIIDPKKLYVEDILMFSKVFEIPDLQKLLNNLELFYAKPVLFAQKKVFWDKFKISPKLHFSAFAFTFSHYLHNKNIQESFQTLRSPIPINQLSVECGWQLNGFQNKYDFAQSLKFWHKLEIDETSLQEIHSNLIDFENNLLIEQEQNIPQEFCQFQTFEEVRDSRIIEITTDENAFITSETTALLIQNNNIQTNRNIVHKFSLPTNDYYQTNSELDFSLNESSKVLKLLRCLPHDLIILHKKETLDKVTITYREFVNSIPCELF
jgi:hypothetical protein